MSKEFVFSDLFWAAMWMHQCALPYVKILHKYFPVRLQLCEHMADALMTRSSCLTNSAENKDEPWNLFPLFAFVWTEGIVFLSWTQENNIMVIDSRAQTSEGLDLAVANASTNEIWLVQPQGE